jgi:hypothetical protein
MKYIEIVNTVAVSLIAAFCIVKVIEHKDDKNKTHLAVYSSILAVATAIIAYLLHGIYYIEEAKSMIADKVVSDLFSGNETLLPGTSDIVGDDLLAGMPSEIKRAAGDNIASLGRNSMLSGSPVKGIVDDDLMAGIPSEIKREAGNKFKSLVKNVPTGIKKAANDIASLAKNVPTEVKKAAGGKLASLAKKVIS